MTLIGTNKLEPATFFSSHLLPFIPSLVQPIGIIQQSMAKKEYNLQSSSHRVRKDAEGVFGA